MLAALRPAALAAVMLVLLPAHARSSELVPLGDEVRVNVFSGWQQEWGKVAMDPDGTRFAVAWSSVQGDGCCTHDCWVRFYDGDGTPTTGEIRVNTVLTGHIQDEPMAAMDADGNVLVCWSDRNGYDGFQMGCFGRVFDATGTPMGPEIQLNQSGASASQWEPMPAALPGGGWAVAFNGDLDGDAYLRLFDVDGTPRTGDIPINTAFDNNGQTEAEVAVLPDGNMLAVFADFGANVQSGTGTNLFIRPFDIDGAYQGPEVVAHTLLPFDQLEPRIAASGLQFGLGTFVMVWEDWGNDGSGAGVWARIYNETGVPIGAAFQVNQTTSGDQRLPEVDCDHMGNFIVTWEDHSPADARIMARCYDRDGNARGGEFEVSQAVGGGDYLRPSVAVNRSGQSVIFSYSGPTNLEDVFIRRYAWEPLSLSGPLTVGATTTLTAELPGSVGFTYALLASFGTSTGLPLPDGRHMALDVDSLFQLAFFFPSGGQPFEDFQGLVPLTDEVSGTITLPNSPALIGVPVHFAAISLDLVYPSLLLQLRHVTDALDVTLE